MPSRPLVLAVLLALALPPTLSQADPPEDIALVVHGLRSDRGEVRAALYASSDGWAEQGREIARCHAHIARGRARCVFPGVAPGTYAIAMLHDEDDDGQMDRDLLGVPQEGFAFSNDVGPSGLGPPSFDSAQFTHGNEATSVPVRVRYGI